ncbi:MAG: TolC family protein [Saprospiraceae bacterium]|nr:TolC family protein [Saprospiraceae bacterium]
MEKRILLFFVFALLIQSVEAQKTDIQALLGAATKFFPLLNAKQMEIQALKKRSDLVDIAKRPSLDASYQADLATYNNLTGMFLSNGITPISGPPSVKNFFEPVFGSAAALLATWQPFAFGQDVRQKKVIDSEANVKKAESDNELFYYQIRVLNAYLDWQLAGELVDVFQKNVERAEELSKQVNALTINGLKPASDSAMLIGEISRLKIEVLNAQKLQEAYRISLNNFIGTNDNFKKERLFFEKLPVLDALQTVDNHPLIRLSTSQIGVGEAQIELIKNQLVPKLQFWGTTYARGSGVKANGETNFINGLGLQRFNYGFGAQISYPLLRGAEIKTQTQAQEILTESYRERLKNNKIQLTENQRIAANTLESALKVVREMPNQKQANDYVLQALTGRYKNGLVAFSEIIQAQYGVIKTESDTKKAYWEAWKALLFQSATGGDVNIFLNQLN